MSGELYVRQDHKDTLFRDLFSDKTDKKNALSLYNALNKTAYEDAEELEIVTLSDVIYMHGKNDVSVLFQNQMELWEHRKAGKTPAEAVDLAVGQCIKEGMLKEYLLKKKSQVKLMLLTEFNEELFAKTMKEEGLEEGVPEERIRSKLQRRFKLTEEKAAEYYAQFTSGRQ